jgi:AraC family transcriptional regulator of adaptative response / DNA-3-methyladenine glycosylase II
LATVPAEVLGGLGIVRQRQSAIAEVARNVAVGALKLHAGADVDEGVAKLQSLRGVGPWTAQYIAMRALGWPDAFPGGDVAIQSALAVRAGAGPAKATLAATNMAEAWRPWRSYAVICAWAGKLLPKASLPTHYLELSGEQ